MDIKLSRTLVREKLDKDHQFKEYYNSLSEEEKKEIKKLLLSHKELKDSISESHVYDDYIKETIMRLHKEEVEAKGYKSILSKKAKIYASSKIFCYKIDNKHLVAVKFYPKKKALEFEVNRLTEVPSPKGKLYIKECSPHLVITGHFFDRYSERLNISGERDDIIFSYLIKSWKGSTGTAIDPQGNVTTLIQGGGLGLGAIVVDIILLKTYISEEQVSHNQKYLRDNIHKHLSLVA